MNAVYGFSKKSESGGKQASARSKSTISHFSGMYQGKDNLQAKDYQRPRKG